VWICSGSNPDACEPKVFQSQQEWLFGDVDMNCPNCGMLMEEGYIETETWISPLKWKSKIGMFDTILGIGGEKLHHARITGVDHLNAFRCSNCRIIIFRY
jgi:hypothetical protein